jgi:uncharacterized membrane protein HdeD (DUF308 family)
MGMPRRPSVLLLGIWLILMGLFALVPSLAFNGSSQLMALLAIAAGIFVLLER